MDSDAGGFLPGEASARCLDAHSISFGHLRSLSVALCWVRRSLRLWLHCLLCLSSCRNMSGTEDVQISFVVVVVALKN